MSDETRRIGIVLDLLQRLSASSTSGLDVTVGVPELDDCAVVPLGHDLDLVIGADFVRGEGFRLFKLGLLSHFDLGYYLIGANASDLAAMGANPVGVTVIVRYTDYSTDEGFRDIMTGAITACRELRMPLLGGDTGSYDAPVLAATAFGVCPHGRALLRSQGRPGDSLFLSGTIGTAGAAFEYFGAPASRRSLGEDIETELLQPWRRVQPALLQGQLLVRNRLARCAIDTSDGLRTASRQLAKASNVDVIADADSLPIPACVRAVAQVLDRDPIELACSDSVDFRLLFSVGRDQSAQVEQAFSENGWPLYRIGELAESTGAHRALLRTNNRLLEIPGYEK